MNIWHDLSPERVSSEIFTAIIEIPKGSKTKYELDKETGLLVLDRILHTSTCYPANYGLIPLTYADDKIIAVPCNDPSYNTYEDISQLPPHIMREMCHFFTVYKELENKQTNVDEIKNRDAAKSIIEKAINDYLLYIAKK